jgi:hypothetical protein
MNETTRSQLKTIAQNWKPYGCLPCEVVVSDAGCVGCPRPIVSVTFAGRGDRTEYLGEFDTGREAEHFAGRCEAVLDMAYEA